MNASDDIKRLIQSVESGDLDKYVPDLEGTDFGIYVPTYVDGNIVKPMLQGYSQVEKNLKVSVSKGIEDAILDAKPVAWVGGQDAKDSKCRHGGTASCKHCTTHTGNCRHCTGHKDKVMSGLTAPELDYDLAIKKLDEKRHLLEPLAKHQVGLTLLHGHSDEFMFTKLPEGVVSVVVDGTTTFRTEQEVLADPKFVPNIWRVTEGRLRIAGGYSGG